MKRPVINGPCIVVTLLLLIVLGCAFYANPHNVLELGRWSASAQWNPSLHLRWDGLAAAFLTLALIALLAVSFFFALAWGAFGLAFAFGFTALAGSTELFLFGWTLLTGPLLARPRSGIWIATSLTTLFLAVLSLHGVFGTSDLRECLRLSMEPYDFPTLVAERATWLIAACVASLATALFFLRTESAEATLRFRVLGVLACGLVSARTAFLSTVSGHFFPFNTRLALPIAALVAGLVFAFARSAPAAAKGPSKQLRRWHSAVESMVRWLEERFWPGLWRIPVQTGRTFGLFFDYWQGGTPQYSLLVLLLGTLVLFWAALKTQVIW